MSFSCPFCSTQRKDIYAHIDSYHQDISLDKKIEYYDKRLKGLKKKMNQYNAIEQMLQIKCKNMKEEDFKNYCSLVEEYKNLFESQI